MAKASQRFVCSSCGAVTAKWSGRCDSCGEWNTIVEEAASAAGVVSGAFGKGGAASAPAARGGKIIELQSLTAPRPEPKRNTTGIGEFDRALGGGFVPGSAILIGGDPGIGKSTLLLQVSALAAQSGMTALYVSGEEGVEQLSLRAQRLGLQGAPVRFASAGNLRDILATLERELGPTPGPSLVIIDSIQTVWFDAIESAPGTVSQVRAASHELVQLAKRSGAVVCLVGHVTKEGQIAGPRVVEHMVDAVLYFEGERGHHFRLLRTVKNRFGPAGEIGVFEMTGTGLQEVKNPSALFLSDRTEPAPGAAVFAGIEGTRPVLVEIQALVAPSPLGTPRRTVVGWDTGRLAMIVAVLDTHAGLGLSSHDVYLNVAGGLRISEPAADLAVAGALVSSLLGVPLPADTVVFGEISLSGSVRPVSAREARAREAAKLGFGRLWAPTDPRGLADDSESGLLWTGMTDVSDLVEAVRASGPVGNG